MQYYEIHAQIVKDFLAHKLTVEGKSSLTVREYGHDLQTFFRYMIKRLKKLDIDFNEIDIKIVDIEFIKRITMSDIYEYLIFLNNELHNQVRTRARKLSSVRSLFKYISVNRQILEKDVAKDIALPKIPKSLPKYLELDESKLLLSAVGGKNKERDFLILMILLNCGLRVSELFNIKLRDIKNNKLIVTGKGNKDRQLYLNNGTIEALNDYLAVRNSKNCESQKLLISSNGKELTVAGIQYIIKYSIRKAGLDATTLSTHKLRHTAATLMYKYGDVDIKTLQTVLGHENLNTTEIYTHTDDKRVEEAINKNPLSDYKNKLT